VLTETFTSPLKNISVALLQPAAEDAGPAGAPARVGWVTLGLGWLRGSDPSEGAAGGRGVPVWGGLQALQCITVDELCPPRYGHRAP